MPFLAAISAGFTTSRVVLPGDGGGGGGGGGSSIAWGGDRGFVMGGETSSRVNDIEYYDISTTGDAADFGNLTQARNNGAAASNGTRALYASGGISSGPTNVIDYITCATAGDATDFGDVTGDNGSEYGRTGLTGVGDGTYGIFMGGQIQSSYGSNVIDRVTIDTPGNAQDFGDLTLSVVRYSTSTNDATRGVNISGQNQSSFLNYMDYITMATPGNATDFGDPLQQILYGSRGNVGNDTIGVFGGGYPDTNYVHSNVLQKITVQTTANATDFGDLTAGAINSAATTNGSRGMFTGLQRSGGYVVDMEYITIDTPGNATDFGDLTVAKGTASGVSGSAGGGGGGGGSIAWGGDRGVFAGGYASSAAQNTIDYVDITNAGNATDFGDISETRNGNRATASSTRFVSGTGYTGSVYSQTLDYITTATTGNASDFGDYQVSGISNLSNGVVSSGTRGLFAGGYSSTASSRVNDIHYITIANTGNSTDFGDLTVLVNNVIGAGDGSRGLFAGGQDNSFALEATISYVTIASTGNALDFGDLTLARKEGSGAADATRSVFLGGSPSVSAQGTVIDYVTTQTTGNAQDFGDLSGYRLDGGAASNGTKALTTGYLDNVTSNVIEQVTIQTTANATDFGDLTLARNGHAGGSGAAS
jgi:hypothetical protein